MSGQQQRWTWVVSGSSSIEHAMTTDMFAEYVRAGDGRFQAICGATYVAGSMCVAGRICTTCRILIQKVFNPGNFGEHGVRGRHRAENCTSFALSRLGSVLVKQINERLRDSHNSSTRGV